MSSLRDTIGEEIQNVLEHITEDKVKDTLDYLIREGVKKPADLRHITVNMLKNVLDTIDSSDLYAHWQKRYNAPECSSSSAHSAASSSRAGCAASTSSSVSRTETSGRQPLQDLARNVLADEVPTYDVESPYMPSCVKAAVKAGKRPTSSGREMFAERIVDHCSEIIPNLQRGFFLKVARKIVQMYPDSFKDTLPISDHGSDGLGNQLRWTYDNKNRNKNKRTATQLQAPACKQAFGCISWNPSLPPGETLESQETLKGEMKTMYRVSSRDWDWRVIKTKLKASFHLQRKEINGTLVTISKQNKKSKRNEDQDEEASVDEPTDMTIVQIRFSWPFLFTSKGINYHFLLLTGVDFNDKLSDFLTNEGPELVEFLSLGSEELKRMRRRMLKAEKQGLGNALLCGLLLMLITYLKDDRDELFTFVEATSTFEMVQESTAIKYPTEKTPFLIIAGTSLYEFEKIYFTADCKVITSVRRVSDAIVLLFTSYYVFNYLYNSKLSGILLYIQRAIAKLNGTSGSKCQSAQLLKRSNDRVRSLSNKFADMQEKWKTDDARDN